MGGKLQGAAERKRISKLPRAPELSSVRREVEVEEIGQEEVETAMHKMKKGKATGADEVRLEMLERWESSGQEGYLTCVCRREGYRRSGGWA